jgi:hypothetical protein
VFWTRCKGPAAFTTRTVKNVTTTGKTLQSQFPNMRQMLP